MSALASGSHKRELDSVYDNVSDEDAELAAWGPTPVPVSAAASVEARSSAAAAQPSMSFEQMLQRTGQFKQPGYVFTIDDTGDDYDEDDVVRAMGNDSDDEDTAYYIEPAHVFESLAIVDRGTAVRALLEKPASMLDPDDACSAKFATAAHVLATLHRQHISNTPVTRTLAGWCAELGAHVRVAPRLCKHELQLGDDTHPVLPYRTLVALVEQPVCMYALLRVEPAGSTADNYRCCGGWLGYTREHEQREFRGD